MYEELSKNWIYINYTVDILFLIDIFVNFNLATYDEDFVVIEDRAKLAKNYLGGWFTIDVMSIIPFDLMI